MAKNTALINGRVVDVRRGTDEVMNLLFNESGVIVGMGYIPDDDSDDTRVIDLKGNYIVPNVVDSHTSLREPGDEDKETLASASLAALQQGITLLVSTPDTNPPIDTPEMVSFMHTRRKSTAHVPVYTMGTVSKGLKGQELAELRLMAESGVIGFTDGNSLEHTGLMRHALQYSSDLNLPIVITPEDPMLSQNGTMTEGYYSTILGLRGIPSETEEIRLARDIQLLERFGGVLHVFPISTAQGVELVRRAKVRGLAITCGTAPQYLWFDESDVEGYNTNFRLKPPLSSRADVEALFHGILDGTIDVIASHHQPHTIDSKRTDFVSSSPGISGIDTLIPATVTRLISQAQMTVPAVFKLLSANPLSIFRLKKPGIALNSKPSLSVFELKSEFTLTSDMIRSQGKNNPFVGEKLIGQPILTMIDGEVKWVNPRIKPTLAV